MGKGIGMAETVLAVFMALSFQQCVKSCAGLANGGSDRQKLEDIAEKLDDLDNRVGTLGRTANFYEFNSDKIGAPLADKGYMVDGQRCYFEIDGKPISEYTNKE